MAVNQQDQVGFKFTKIGWIPKDWDVRTLISISDIYISNVDKKIVKNETPILLCNYMDVYQNNYIDEGIIFSTGTAKKEEIEKFSIKQGDILITKDSETSEDIASAALVINEIQNLVCGYHLAIIRLNNNEIKSQYLVKTFANDFVHDQFVKKANGVTRFGLTKSTIENLLVPIPTIIEQQKIANVLTTWDLAIESLEKLIDAKQRLKKRLMQQLLTGKLRFPQFGELAMNSGEIPNGWKYVSFQKIFKLIKRKNIDELTLVLTISGEHGLINQKEYFNKSVAGKELKKYYHIKGGEFAYNRSSMIGYPYGAIKRLDEYENGVLSTLYICFACRDQQRVISDYFRNYFDSGMLNSQLRKITQVGGRAHGLLNITNKDFINIDLLIPGEEEQRQITNTLSSIDEEIDNLKLYKLKIETQKQGLMQKLLTGKVRVKI